MTLISLQSKEDTTRSLKYVRLFMYHESLTSDLLEATLFSSVVLLEVRNVLDSIDTNVLNQLFSLHDIGLFVSNMRHLFHSNDITWLGRLNSHRVTLRDLSSRAAVEQNMWRRMQLKLVYERAEVSFDRVYTYPDEDLCLFADFPHAHLVLPIIVPGEKLACTCTLAWLQRYTHLYAQHVRLYDDNYDQSDMYVRTKEFETATFLFCAQNIHSECERRVNACREMTKGKYHDFNNN